MLSDILSNLVLMHQVSHCMKFGLYLENILKRMLCVVTGEPIPVDHENWLQCHNCGLIVPINEAKIEPTIKDVIETSEPRQNLLKLQRINF